MARSVVSLSLPEELASELEEYARKRGRNRSDVMKEALGMFLWEERFKAARARLVRRAKDQGIVTDEDVFDAIS